MTTTKEDWVTLSSGEYGVTAQVDFYVDEEGTIIKGHGENENNARLNLIKKLRGIQRDIDKVICHI